MHKFSVKKPLTVFVSIIAVLVLGVVAYLKMTPDLLPNMDFPYVIIMTAYPGATPEKVEAFMADNGYEFPLYYDSEYDAAYTYGIYSIPVSLFIDADGNLSKGYIGALNAAVIESCIQEILP